MVLVVAALPVMPVMPRVYVSAAAADLSVARCAKPLLQSENLATDLTQRLCNTAAIVPCQTASGPDKAATMNISCTSKAQFAALLSGT